MLPCCMLKCNLSLRYDQGVSFPFRGLILNFLIKRCIQSFLLFKPLNDTFVTVSHLLMY